MSTHPDQRRTFRWSWSTADSPLIWRPSRARRTSALGIYIDKKHLHLWKCGRALLSEDSHIIFQRFSTVEGTLRTFAVHVISFVRDISPTSIGPLSWLAWLAWHVLTTWRGGREILDRDRIQHYSFHVCTHDSANEVVMSIVVPINPHFMGSQTGKVEKRIKNALGLTVRCWPISYQ